MVSTTRFVSKHWLTLALVAACVVTVVWIVRTQRAPGSMTFLESQGMDMAGGKPPSGSLPVKLFDVQPMAIGVGPSLPATVRAWTDEDVVARVNGRVSKVLVYPGDHVVAGQLLATLDAPELDSEIRQAQAMAGAKESEIISAEREIEHHRGIEAQSKAAIDEAQSNVKRAQAELDASKLELQRWTSEAASQSAAVGEMNAELTYAEQNLQRKKSLYESGAISLDSLQSAQKDRDAAQSRLARAQSEVKSANDMIEVARMKQSAAAEAVTGAKAALNVAIALAEQAKEGVAQAHADAQATRMEASAATAEVTKAQAIANYRELRALTSGVVAERVVSSGTAVVAGQTVLKLRSISKVRIQADVPETMAADFRTGSQVVLSGEGFKHEAVITSVFPSVDPDTRTFRVEAVVNNQGDVLKPGMFLKMQMLSKTSVKRLAVPSSSVTTTSTGSFVWLAVASAQQEATDWTCTMHPQVSENGPGKCPICGMDLVPRRRGGRFEAHRQAVTIASPSNGMTPVLTGLKAGDLVVASDTQDLQEGSALTSSVEMRAEPDSTGKSVNSEKDMPDMPGMDTPPKASPKPSPNTHPSEGQPNPWRSQSKPAASTVEYTCPMHPEVISDKPGDCPKCGMKLVKKTKGADESTR